jgi:hypothetical protein
LAEGLALSGGIPVRGQHAVELAAEGDAGLNPKRLASSNPGLMHRGHDLWNISGRSFEFFRTARPDATDPRTGRRTTRMLGLLVAGG